MAMRRVLSELLRKRAVGPHFAATDALVNAAARTTGLSKQGSMDAMDSALQAASWRAVMWGSTLAGAAYLATPSTASCAPSRLVEPKTGDIDLSKMGMQVQQRTIVFVLGGPGSGKGTQCAKLVKEFGVVHLSAGDLLREHMKSGTDDGNMVADMIKQGQIVPSHVTISLLDKAMLDSGKDRFLIDGFPRNEENRSAFEKQMVTQPNFILFFDCPEEVMIQRLMGRNEGRTDDNMDTIKKRFKVFLDSSMPVVQHYEELGKVRRFKSDRDPEEIYQEVRKLF